MDKIDRPIVRSFAARFARQCADWVKSGGHAVYWKTPEVARVVFQRPARGDIGNLGTWSALDLGVSRRTLHRQGVFRGLASIRVPADCNDIVRRRARRDSIHEGPTRAVAFDCLTCGACCKDNEVILERRDLKRFMRGGRSDLMRRPIAARREGKLMLTLLGDGRCRQLRRDLTCAIYTLRPNACRDFPVASECCLFAREEELGIVDGAHD